jgi:hypothetical protein
MGRSILLWLLGVPILSSGTQGASGEIPGGGAARRWLWLDLEWPEELERCRDPGAGGKSRKKRGGAYRATRRTSTAAILKRRSTACSSGVSTFPMAIPHPGRSRLQAALVRAPDILRGNTAQARCARRAGWRLQRHAHRAGCLQAGTLARRCAFPPRSPQN